MAPAGLVADLISAVHAAGGTIRRDGDMIELSAPAPLSADLVVRIREAKLALLEAFSESPDWCTRHREALAYWGALHPADEAAWLAWGELQNRWHRLHGDRVPEWQCAGCDAPIGGLPALDLADGNRAHLDRLDCVIRYGQRWRGAATQALAAMGLHAPPGQDMA